MDSFRGAMGLSVEGSCHGTDPRSLHAGPCLRCRTSTRRTVLRSDDLDPTHRLLRVRAETTKGRRERVLPYSCVSSELLQSYLRHRRTLASRQGPLFLSESPRNYSEPLSLWTWSKVIRSCCARRWRPCILNPHASPSVSDRSGAIGVGSA